MKQKGEVEECELHCIVIVTNNCVPNPARGVFVLSCSLKEARVNNVPR